MQLLNVLCLHPCLLWLPLHHPQLPTTLVQLELDTQLPCLLCVHSGAQLQLPDRSLHSIAQVGWLLALLLQNYLQETYSGL